MKQLRFYLAAICSLPACLAVAQKPLYEMSAPVDLKTTGVNKVLCMKNGNTMLFHFDPTKTNTVIVFDSSRKKIASEKDDLKEFDVYMNEFAVFKGLFDINNEAVLFLDQDKKNHHSLVRMRYNSHTGHLVEERTIAESQNENKRMKYYVMKNKSNDNYEILFCTDIKHPKQTDLYIVFFDSLHKSLREVQLPVDRKLYDDLEVVGAESQDNGVLVTVSMIKTKVWGVGGSKGAIGNESSVDEHFVQFFYIPKEGEMTTARVDLSTGVFPFLAHYTYNAFARALNLFLFSDKAILYQFGQNVQAGNVTRNLFFKIDEGSISSMWLKEIKNVMANTVLKSKTDTFKYFDGIPVRMFTEPSGLTTIISEKVDAFGIPETRVRYNHENYFKNIGITQVDDDGNEIWGTVLPFTQYFKSYKHYLNIREQAKGWQTHQLFGDLPAQVYDRQFLSFKAYSKDRNYYIIYNDYDKNFGNTLEKPGDTVYTFESTNACLYKINKKKEVVKEYLFGDPVKNEYKCSFIEGADFDRVRGTYATLVQYHKGEDISLRMAWRRLE